MNNKINFCLPGFYNGFKIYQHFIKLYHCNKELFIPNVNIYKIFDSFPNMTWNGGGSNFGHFIDLDEMIEIIDFYNSNGIGLQLTATNPLLEKEDCYDRYGNTVVDLMNKNPLNEILVSSICLEEYLREKYKNIKISRSIIATKEDIDYNNIVNNYEHIVLPKRLVNNLKELDKIKVENRGKVELLCNDPCPTSCNRLYTHYNDFAKTTLYQTGFNDCLKCSMEKRFLDNPIYQIEPNNISEYLEKGFNIFKISGRTDELLIIYGIVQYMIKPEYQFKVAYDLFETIY